MTLVQKQLIRSTVPGMLALFAMIFIPAGRLDYWQGWAYLGTAVLASGLYTLYVAIYDPALLQRRMQVGPGQEREPVQKVIVVSLFIAFIALIASPPLDYRFGGSRVSWHVSLAGDFLVALSFYFFYLVAKVNTYAAANVRVEEGQKVVDTGIYRMVRHPMYFGALFLVIGTPLALGSWRTLLLVPVFLIILFFRIVSEEKVLVRDLPGYTAYQKKVKYRLVSFIW
jgi:protein-S-isoprenylcysteine O-methyltransferase Ste14